MLKTNESTLFPGGKYSCVVLCLILFSTIILSGCIPKNRSSSGKDLKPSPTTPTTRRSRDILFGLFRIVSTIQAAARLGKS